MLRIESVPLLDSKHQQSLQFYGLALQFYGGQLGIYIALYCQGAVQRF